MLVSTLHNPRSRYIDISFSKETHNIQRCKLNFQTNTENLLGDSDLIRNIKMIMIMYVPLTYLVFEKMEWQFVFLGTYYYYFLI